MAQPDMFLEKYGPTALITGASSGIGRSFAELLAAKGMNLVLAARRVDRLQAMATQFTAQHGVQVQVCEVDLAQVTAAAQILDATASLDIGLVVSNAGFNINGPHENHATEKMTAMLMVNSHTPMQLAHGFIPRLKARGKGGIIFTSSVEGLLGMPYSGAYSASKSFVIRLGEALWGELTPSGIDVLTVCPGATDTEALSGAGFDAKTMPNVMSPDDVARQSLENIAAGPTFVAHPFYQAMFDQLLAMPRAEALAAVAAGMRQH